MPRAALLALACLLAAAPARAAAEEGDDVVHLVPEDKAAWDPGQLFNFLRPGHNYGERKIRVETTPSHAVLDLYYVRAGFQKRYEQADSPATVVLPKRAEASDRDSVTIRASADGYEPKEVTLRVKGSEDGVLLELEPLANTLHAVSHTYFGGRGSLTLLTEEALQVRVQKGDRAFQLALHDTARGPELEESFAGLKSPLVASVGAQQLGSDLMLRVALADAEAARGLDLRSRQGHDPLRDLHTFSVDFVPADGDAGTIEAARAALARITREDVTGCALAFDRTLRGSLEEADLTRALAPDGDFTDRYLRAAMRRLGEVSPGGAIRMPDGTAYAASSELELSAAMSQAAHARGYLALLRRFTELLEPDQGRAALRSLVASELGAARFDALVDEAEAAEARCE